MAIMPSDDDDDAVKIAGTIGIDDWNLDLGTPFGGMKEQRKSMYVSAAQIKNWSRWAG